MKNEIRSAMDTDDTNSYKHHLDSEAVPSVEETGQHLQEQDDRVHFRLSGDIGQLPSTFLSQWRSPLVGYLVGPLLVAATLLIAHFYFLLVPVPYFTGAPFFLTTVITAWLWGGRPALFVILLEFLGLEIFIIPPLGIFSFSGWIHLAMFGPWVFSQLAVALITIQRESAQRRLDITEPDLLTRSPELTQ